MMKSIVSFLREVFRRGEKVQPASVLESRRLVAESHRVREEGEALVRRIETDQRRRADLADLLIQARNPPREVRPHVAE